MRQDAMRKQAGRRVIKAKVEDAESVYMYAVIKQSGRHVMPGRWMR